MPEVEIGHVTDFFAHPVVAGITLTGPLAAGEKVHIKGHTTDMTLVVESIEINRVKVGKAGAGDAIGIKVEGRVRHGDKVYKVLEG
jgi:translation elongation factor EF-Tu-like GTPase